MNGTVGIEAAKNLHIETNFSSSKFDTLKSSVFHLFSLSVMMKLQLFFCLPVSRFNSLKMCFGEFKNWASRSSNYSRFFDRRNSQSRFLIFVFFRRSAISLLSVKREFYPDYVFSLQFCQTKFLFDFASFILSLKVKTLTAVVSASARLSVELWTSCFNFDSLRQCLKFFKYFSS